MWKARISIRIRSPKGVLRSHSVIRYEFSIHLNNYVAEELQKEEAEGAEEKVLNIYQTYFTEEITKLRELVLKCKLYVG